MNTFKKLTAAGLISICTIGSAFAADPTLKIVNQSSYDSTLAINGLCSAGQLPKGNCTNITTKTSSNGITKPGQATECIISSLALKALCAFKSTCTVSFFKDDNCQTAYGTATVDTSKIGTAEDFVITSDSTITHAMKGTESVITVNK